MHVKRVFCLLLSVLTLLCFSLPLSADSEAELYISKAKKKLRELQRISDQIRRWEKEAARKIQRGDSLERALRPSELRRWENQLLKMFPTVGKELKVYRLWVTYIVLSGVKRYPPLQKSYQSLLPEFPLKDKKNQILPFLLRFVFQSRELLDASNPRWNSRERVVEFPNLIAQSKDDGDSWVFHLKVLWNNPKLTRVMEQALQDRRRCLEGFHRWVLYLAKVKEADRQILQKLSSSSPTSAAGEVSAIGTLKALFTAQNMFRLTGRNGRNYADFLELDQSGLFSRFDKVLSPNKAKKGGYIFLLELQRVSGNGRSSFKVYAYPEHPRYGSRAFLLLSSNRIYYKDYWSDKKLPTTRDPMIE